MSPATLDAFCNGASPGMPAWAIACIVLGSAFVYALIAGAIYATFPDDERRDRWQSVNEGPVAAAIFWKIAGPVLLGIYAVSRLGEWREARSSRVPTATAKEVRRG